MKIFPHGWSMWNGIPLNLFQSLNFILKGINQQFKKQNSNPSLQPFQLTDLKCQLDEKIHLKFEALFSDVCFVRLGGLSVSVSVFYRTIVYNLQDHSRCNKIEQEFDIWRGHQIWQGMAFLELDMQHLIVMNAPSVRRNFLNLRIFVEDWNLVAG